MKETVLTKEQCVAINKEPVIHSSMMQHAATDMMLKLNVILVSILFVAVFL